MKTIGVEKLTDKYKEIFSAQENRPDWAVEKSNGEGIVHPCIPFVGDNYRQTRILLYASAENLVHYHGYLDDDKLAVNRYRSDFDNSNRDKFFPDVHIQPINDGGLVNILGYVAMKLIPDFKFNTPRELLEGTSFANFGKFSIGGLSKNKDYASDKRKVEQSLEYIRADLSVLQPKLLIMPSTIHNHANVKNMLRNEYPQIKVITIYQISHFNIDAKNRLGRFPQKAKKELGILADWQDHFGGGLTGKRRDNFLSFYTYLDDKIENIEN